MANREPRHISGLYSGGEVHGRVTKKFAIGMGLKLTISYPAFFDISHRRSGFNQPWAEVQKVLQVANQEMALMVQVAVVEALREGEVKSRDGARTGRLEDAVSDPRNIEVQGNRFGVGKVSWMNESPAGRYWRAIDQGSTASVGRALPPGFWVDRSGSASMSGDRRSDTWFSDSATRALYRKNLKASTQAKHRRHAAQVALTMKGHRNNIQPYSVRIRNPIEAQEFYERGWEKVRPRIKSMATQALRRAIMQVYGIPESAVKGKNFESLSALL